MKGSVRGTQERYSTILHHGLRALEGGGCVRRLTGRVDWTRGRRLTAYCLAAAVPKQDYTTTLPPALRDARAAAQASHLCHTAIKPWSIKAAAHLHSPRLSPLHFHCMTCIDCPHNKRTPAVCHTTTPSDDPSPARTTRRCHVPNPVLGISTVLGRL